MQEEVEQLKAQYEIQCEKDNTNDKRELLEAKRRSQRKHAERKRLLKERENLLRNLRRKEIRSVQRSR